MEHPMYFDEDGYITGWEAQPREIDEKLLSIPMEIFKNRFGTSQWRWDDFPEGVPEFAPRPFTPEQAEICRKEWCQTEISKIYSTDQESKILREKLAGIDEEPFIAYNEAVQKIIEKSKTIDFSVLDNSN